MPEEVVVPQTEAAPEPNPAQEDAAWKAERLAPAQTETPEPEAAKPPEGETGQETEPAKEEQEQPRDEHGKFKAKDDLPENVQKRINKEIARVVAERKKAEDITRELQAKLASIQGTDPAKKPDAPAPTTLSAEPPNIDDYQTVQEWQKANAEWMDARIAAETQRVAESLLKEREERAAKETASEKHRQAMESWEQRVSTVREKHEDFDDVLDAPVFPNSPQAMAVQAAVFEAVLDREDGPELLYHLARDPETVARLSKMTPTNALLEFGQFAASLKPPSTPAKPAVQPISSAPPPPRTVPTKAASPLTTDPSRMTVAQYREWRKSHGR